jgi:PilZ domain-containing protein
MSSPAQSSSESKEDLRAAQRLPASAVPAITGLRIQGQKAILINISETGLLAECGERQMPGNRLTVMVDGAFAPATMRCRVTRTSVAALGSDGKLRYHVGVQFDSRITLDIPAPVEAPAAVVEAVPEAPSMLGAVSGADAVEVAADATANAAARLPAMPAEIVSAATAARQPLVQNRW